MTQTTFQIVAYSGMDPDTSASPPTTDPKNVYASIQCLGANGEILELIYLRPDSPQDLDNTGRVNKSAVDSYDPASKHCVAYFNAFDFAWHRALLTSGRVIQAQLNNTHAWSLRIFTDVIMPNQSQQVVPDVVAWLNQHPNVNDMLRWNESNTGRRCYTDWPPQKQADFLQAFVAAWNHQPMSLDDPPPNLVTGGDVEKYGTVLDANHAWRLFCAHAAYSLAVEIGGRVPWSIVNYSVNELALLLHSDKLFNYISKLNGYKLQFAVVPAPPEFTWAFLSSNDLIGTDRLTTISRVLEWCRHHLVHAAGGDDSTSAMQIWGYAGLPPVSYMIQGTIDVRAGDGCIKHYTLGCGGTTGFLHSALRTVNIPVDNGPYRACGHHVAHFPTEDRYLAHADDPYDLHGKCTPPFDAGLLLIDGATFNSWFGDSVPLAIQETNISRRPVELGVQYLPDYLLYLYYQEKQKGSLPQNGDVYRDLKYYYPNFNDIYPDLWQRLNEKLSEFGYADQPFNSISLPALPTWPNDPHLPRGCRSVLTWLLSQPLFGVIDRWFGSSGRITHGKRISK